jgi:hypothetical protein
MPNQKLILAILLALQKFKKQLFQAVLTLNSSS